MQFAITSARSSATRNWPNWSAKSSTSAADAVARENARLQYVGSVSCPRTPLDAHLAEFDRAWDGMERQWREGLTTSEQEKFAP